MALLDLYFDTARKKLVRSLTDSSDFALPEFHQEDKIALSLRACKLIDQFNVPSFEQISLAGYSMQISVGLADDVYATQSSWTLDSTNYVLSGVLDLATAEITALADGTEVKFEIILSEATPSTFRGIFPVRIRKSVVLTSSLLPVPVGNALSEEKAAVIYLPRSGIRSFTMVDDDGVTYLVRIVNGDLRCEAIT